MRIKKLAQLPHGNGTIVIPREVALREKVENGWDKRRLKLTQFYCKNGTMVELT
jgi:hypothetical protein